ncbi:MAG: hypothetical protein KAH46_25025, partial [Mycobacterium sp.]|nr:hypothetical protein [Mycobacterium sp.]
MRRIPDRRSTLRLVAAWAWWTAQCVIIVAIQLVPGAASAGEWPRIPRRDCSDVRLAERDREDARDRARSRWRKARTLARRL